jgi:hypothetical protein
VSAVEAVNGLMTWVLTGLPGCTVLRVEASGLVATIATGLGSASTTSMFSNAEWHAMETYDGGEFPRWIERKKRQKGFTLEQSQTPTDARRTVKTMLADIGARLTGVKVVE